MGPRVRRRPARVAIAATAAALALVAAGTARPSATAQPDDAGPPPVGPRHKGHAFEHAVYEPSLTGQQVRLSVRCLGVKPHPRRHGALARFWIELHDTTDEELELDEGSLYLDWAREHRAPEQRVRPERVVGQTELEPGEASRVRLRFHLSGAEPSEAHLLRLRWRVLSGTGTQVLLRSVFIRHRSGAGAPFHFAPGYDPFPGIGVRRIR